MNRNTFIFVFCCCCKSYQQRLLINKKNKKKTTNKTIYNNINICTQAIRLITNYYLFLINIFFFCEKIIDFKIPTKKKLKSQSLLSSFVRYIFYFYKSSDGYIKYVLGGILFTKKWCPKCPGIFVHIPFRFRFYLFPTFINKIYFVIMIIIIIIIYMMMHLHERELLINKERGNKNSSSGSNRKKS